MKTDQTAIANEARRRLVESGGRISQDLGLGRIVGQIMLYLYLREKECSLDEICGELGLSKASVSIAIRQLESLGLVHPVWKKGDRKNYYRSADNIAAALQQGLLAFLRQKIHTAAIELDHVGGMLETAVGQQGAGADTDLKFLHGRVKRAKELRDSVGKVLESPILGLFLKP